MIQQAQFLAALSLISAISLQGSKCHVHLALIGGVSIASVVKTRVYSYALKLATSHGFRPRKKSFMIAVKKQHFA